MKSRKLTTAFAALSVAFLAESEAAAQSRCSLRPSETVMLYPEGQAAGKGLPEAWGPGESNGITEPEKIPDNGNISNISDNARFDLYFPEKPNGQMVIVCPGGGYGFVSSYNEGTYVADWMLERGITVAVVKYRMPNGHWSVPLTDVQNTFRYCRSHAADWKVTRIGIMGFSAGGHLAASATTLYTDEKTRPDFSILIYPVIDLDWKVSHGGTRTNLIGKDEVWTSREGKSFEQWQQDIQTRDSLVQKYSLQKNVTEDTPPVFLAHCTDDTTVPVENSLMFYRELVRHKVPAEMHIFPSGGHGWGFSSAKFADKDRFGYCRGEFEASLQRWLEAQRGN